MIDLLKEVEKYEREGLEFFQEKSIIDAIILLKKWDNMTDEEKIRERENKADYYEYHFNDSSEEKNRNRYNRKVLNVSILINCFLQLYNVNIGNNLKTNYLYRIYVLLFCELKLINRNISYNEIHHIPFEIFEPLVEKVKDTEEYKNYKLNELFEEYNKMNKLFLEKPYKND